MLLPGMAFMLVFGTFPLLLGGVISLQNFKPGMDFLRSKWVGLANYQFMFMLPDTFQLFRNTLVIAVGKIICTQSVALLFALLLNEIRSTRFRRSVQTVVYLPHFLSWVILAVIFRSILDTDGTLNTALMNLGMIKEPIWFLGSNALFQPVMIITEAWKEFGYAAVIFVAALTHINPELYEAAAIDGCGRLKRIVHITFPGILSTVVLVATLQIAGILNAGFDQIYNMYSPVVYRSGDIIDTYVYRVGIREAQYSLATAVGFIKSIVSFILIMLSHGLAHRFARYSIF
jgi:putative aldouronate transport system permease protein